MTRVDYLSVAMDMVRDGYLKIDGRGRVWRVAVKWWDSVSETLIKVKIPRRRAERRMKSGHLSVGVRAGRRNRNVAAHRIVWAYSSGNIPIGEIINHKNGIKDDNRPSNLEAITLKENSIHARDVLGRWGGPKIDRRGENNQNHDIRESDIVKIRDMLEKGIKHKDIAEKFNVCTTTVHNIRHGKTWAHVP